MNRSTTAAAVALVLVFGAGVAAGVALDRTWLAPDRASGPEATRSEKPEGKKPERERTVIERFSDELELTRDQRARIDTILDHFRDRMHEMWSEVRPRYRTLVDSARTRIVEVLTEEQAEQYRELLRREAERRDGDWNGHEADGDGEDGGRPARKDGGDGDGPPEDGQP